MYLIERVARRQRWTSGVWGPDHRVAQFSTEAGKFESCTHQRRVGEPINGLMAKIETSNMGIPDHYRLGMPPSATPAHVETGISIQGSSPRIFFAKNFRLPRAGRRVA
jgi:hypothetical protein